MTEDLYPSRLDEEKIINRVDKTVYSTKSVENQSLNNEQLKNYEDNGFIMFPNMFIEDEITKLKDELQKMAQNSELMDKEEFISEPSNNELRTIFNQHLYSELFNKVSKD